MRSRTRRARVSGRTRLSVGKVIYAWYFCVPRAAGRRARVGHA
eukprot:SAG11_NODE_8941_length_960_cov_1.891986_1_plen_42_part_10